MARNYLTKFSTIPGLCVRMVLIVSNTSAMCSVSKRSWHSINAQNVPVRPTPSLHNTNLILSYCNVATVYICNTSQKMVHTCSEL